MVTHVVEALRSAVGLAAGIEDALEAGDGEVVGGLERSPDFAHEAAEGHAVVVEEARPGL